MIQKIINAKKDTFVKVNGVVYAKISDAKDSGWRSAFGIKYANAFINMCRQAENVEFLDESKAEEPVETVSDEQPSDEQPVTEKSKKVRNKMKDVREEEPSKD